MTVLEKLNLQKEPSRAEREKHRQKLHANWDEEEVVQAVEVVVVVAGVVELVLVERLVDSVICMPPFPPGGRQH